MARLFDAASWLLCVGAGVYLVTSKTAASDSYLQVIAHGIGIYMIGKGLFIARSLHLQAESLWRLEELAAQTREDLPSG